MMEKELEKRMIDKFILLGKECLEDRESNCLLSEVHEYGNFNTFNWSEQTDYVKGLSITDLAALIKGLTIAESHFKWTGGSVSEIIRIFREFQLKADKALFEELTKWVFDARRNPYLPFGTIKYSSYQDYLWQNSEEYFELKREIQREHGRREKTQREAARIRKIKRQAEAKKHKELAGKKAANRISMLKKLDIYSPDKKWGLIASNTEVSLDYYPKEWADEPDGTFKKLRSETRKALIERFKYVKKGGWKDLRKRLIGFNDEKI